MKALFLLCLSLASFASGEIKYSLLENPFALPSNVPLFNVKNIAKNTYGLDLKYVFKLEKIKLNKLRFLPVLKIRGNFYDLNLSENTSEYSLKNRDDVNQKIKDLDLDAAAILYKKIAKKAVLFFEFGANHHDGYSLEYDLFLVPNKEADYFLISNEHQKYYGQIGVQAKLSDRLRVNSFYNLSLSEHKYDYSIYQINDGQKEDNINHLLAANFSLKLDKSFSIDFNNFISYKLYKNKLALKENGYIISQGEVTPEDLLDLSSKIRFKLNLNSFSPYFEYSYFKRDDIVSGARSVNINGLELGGNLSLSKNFSIDSSYSYKKLDSQNMIASLTDDSDKRLLVSQNRELKFALKYKRLSTDIRHINNDSTRNYDNITYNTYSLKVNFKF